MLQKCRALLTYCPNHLGVPDTNKLGLEITVLQSLQALFLLNTTELCSCNCNVKVAHFNNQ